MAVPPKYRKNPENIFTQYDYFDISDGTAYKEFTMAVASMANVSDILTGIDVSSSVITTSSAPDPTTYQVVNTKTFQTTFNLPKLISGNFLANIGHAVNCNGNGTGNSYIYVTVKKTSGSTTSTLGSASGALITKTNSGSLAATSIIPISVSRIGFKKGDILKVQVDQYGMKTGAANQPTFYLGHDPVGRDNSDAIFGSTATTRSKVLVPFVPDF